MRNPILHERLHFEVLNLNGDQILICLCQPQIGAVNSMLW